MKWVYRMWGNDTDSISFPQHGGGRTSQSRVSRVLLLLLLGALALAPAACGRKGEPVLPPGQSDNFPHRYPQSTDPQQGVFN